MPRLPDIEPDKLSPEQRRVYDEILSGPRGIVEGPLRVWVNSPGLADKAQALVAAGARALTVTVRWGDYSLSEHDPGEGDPIPVWRRAPLDATVELPLGSRPGELTVHDVPDSGGLELHALERSIAAGGGAARHRFPYPRR